MAKKDNKKKAPEGGRGVVLDPRFARITNDLRFMPLKSEKSSFSTSDDRFKNLKQKTSLHGKHDPRGRKFNIHNLGTENSDKPPKGKQSSKKRVVVEEEEEDSDNDQEEDSDNDQEEDSDNDQEEDSDNDQEEDSDNDQEEDSDNDQEEDDKEANSDDQEPDSDDDGDNNDAIDGFVDMDEDPQLLHKMDKAIAEGAKDSDSEVMDPRQQRRLQQLLDPNLDIARGIDRFSGESSSSSSDDDSSSDEDVQDEHDWGELDKDAVWDNEDQHVEETTRLAVCNIEWDLFKAEDILVVLQSFAPTGGKVLKVAVYMSEFGKERKAEEEASGPKEIKDLPKVTEDGDMSKDYETVRKYYISRLKYYYAVAECSSVDTARVIYKQLDGHCFKNGGIVDLRYIPDDMTFDDTPESESSILPKSYSNTKVTDGFSGYNYVKTKFLWDEDDADRKKAISKFLFNADDAKDNPQLNNLLASDSEDNSDEESSDQHTGDITEFTSEYDSVEAQPKSERIKRFKYLMENMHTIDHAKEMELKLLARVQGDKVYENQPKWGEDQGEGSDVTHKESEMTDEEEDSEAEESDDKNKDLSTFERYLLKRDARQKEIKKAKKLQATGGKQRKDMEDDIPDDLKNDPFFKEEFEQRKKEKLKQEAEQRRDQDRELAKQEEERIQREKDLALLMLDDEDAGPHHFDMRELVKQAKEDASIGGKKKLSRWKLAKLTAKAKRLAREGVHLPASETEPTVSTATTEAPVNAKTVVEDDRFSAIFNDHRANLDPSHPEYTKNRTPFMDSLIKEVQDKSVGSTKRPADNTVQSSNKRPRVDATVTTNKKTGKDTNERKNKKMTQKKK